MYEMREHVRNQVKWITQLTYENIPEKVMERARWVLLDSIGCILNGLDEKKLPKERNAKILKSTAAMVSTELYEGNRYAIGHPASHIVPILLTEAEKQDLSYKDVLKIFVCAYEVAARWGNSIRFSNDILGHGTIMISGASVVEGMVSGISESDFINYIMLCESLPEVSTWQSVFEGSALHDYYPGMAAVNAQNALYLMKDNTKSSEQLVRSVYSKIAGTEIIPENLSSGLGDDWYLLKNYFKIHTGCRFIHPFADVLEQLLKEGLRKEEIDEVHVFTYKKASRLTSQKVPNALAAKFSTPVALATLLIKGRLYPEDIAEAVKDEEVKALSTHIYLEEDDKYNAMLPAIRGGCVKVKKKNGEIIEREVFHAKGDFDNPEKFTEERLITKFKDVTTGKLETLQQENLCKRILTGDAQLTAREVFCDYYKVVR